MRARSAWVAMGRGRRGDLQGREAPQRGVLGLWGGTRSRCSDPLWGFNWRSAGGRDFRGIEDGRGRYGGRGAKRVGVGVCSCSWGPALRTTATDDGERMVVKRERPRGACAATSYVRAQLCQPRDVAAQEGTYITSGVGQSKLLWCNG